MIKELDHKNENTSHKIRSLFQASYKVEAALLNATDFPPLKRSLEGFLNSNTRFYGLCVENEIAGIVEVRSELGITEIDSLVVHPSFFRQGVGRQLMQFVLTAYNSDSFIVETGYLNEPATKLYKQLGFKEEAQWETDFGIRKVRFVKNCSVDT